MKSKELRGKFLPYAIIVGFTLNFLLGLSGALCPDNSLAQVILWQGAMTCMISACVLMGSYVAKRGWSLAAGGFVLLGIAHGGFYASLGVNSYNPVVMARGIIILIPSFIFIGMSNYFPPLLKWMSIAICIPFLTLYVRVLTGTYVFNELIQNISFTYLEIIAVLWGFNVWQELKRNKETESQEP
jgi:hypothetical protein